MATNSGDRFTFAATAFAPPNEATAPAPRAGFGTPLPAHATGGPRRLATSRAADPQASALGIGNDGQVRQVPGRRRVRARAQPALLADLGQSGQQRRGIQVPVRRYGRGDGAVYVADGGNNRIQEFDAAGRFLRKWGRNGGDGTAGSGDGEFDAPSSVAVAANGHVDVAGFGNDRVQEFDATAAFVPKWGRKGHGTGRFFIPAGVAAAGDGFVDIADDENHRIVRVQPL